MSDIKSKYGTSSAITISLTSMATGNARESDVIDNTSDLFLDALVQFEVKTGGSSTSPFGRYDIYAYASVDSTHYSGGATGSDAAYTMAYPGNLRLIGSISVSANGTTYVSSPFSVAQAFGGHLPPKWGIIFDNQAGSTIDASVASAWYQGVLGQV